MKKFGQHFGLLREALFNQASCKFDANLPKKWQVLLCAYYTNTVLGTQAPLSSVSTRHLWNQNIYDSEGQLFVV